MMSSEEDTDSFGLYVDKLLKKNKRARQRVDAGEPRNSYSSIPNFSSRPSSFMSGGLYGAIFSQSQQHFGGLFGYGPANKMLNELLGRQVKQAQDASDPDSISMLSSIEAANAADNSNTPTSKHGFESTTNLINNNNNSSTTNNNNNGANNNSPTSDVGSVMMGRRSSNNSANNTANNGGGNNNQQNNNSNSNSSSGVIDLDGGSRTPQPNDLAHHMLRNILQGKKELMALDHELRTASNQSSALGDRISPDNNNVISKNNNIYDISKCETVNGGSGDVSDSSELGANNNKVNQKNSATNNQTNSSDNNSQQVTRPISLDSNNSNCDDMLASELAHTERLLNGVSGSGNGAGSTGGRCSSVNPKQEKSDVIDELVASLPDEVDETMPSPASGSNGVIITKQELDMDDCLEDKDRDDRTPSPAPSKNDSESMTLKRARVENIVSSMRASPALLGSQQGQVNGCKKRKLYHPQQHDNSAAERYAAAAAAGLNLGLTLQNFMLGASADPDDDDDDMEVTPHIHQKRVEKDVLKSQLRSMQEQLAEMQQKYVQLCSRMEQQSDTQEVDDSASDIMEDDSNNPDLSPDKSLIQSSPASTPIKDMGKNADASSMLQMMSKMMSAKIHSQLPTHPHMPGGFNGTHLFLQHMQQQAGLPHDGMSQHSQMSNAAMYQKLFMEQEARMVKEVAEQQERNLQNSANQQMLQQQALQQQQMQQQQQHQERNNSNQQQMMQQQQQNQPPQPQLQSPQHPANQSQQQQQQQQQQQMQMQQMQQHQPPSQPNHISPPQMPPMPHLPQIPKGSSIPSDLTSRLNMMRSSVSSVGPMSGTDLEGLADVLKTEITASLSNLVDSIVTRFVHQRRFLGKQSEAAAAAAEQLNKDLMMASQLLDRSKSPRTKVSADRGPTSGNGSSSNQSGNGPMLGNNLNSAPNSNQPPAGNPMIPGQQGNGPRLNGTAFPPMGMPMHVNNAPTHDPKNMNNMNQINMPPHVRPSPSTAMFQTPKPPQNLNSVAAAALYNSMSALGSTQVNPFCMPEPRENPEQAEALSLVVTPKKKRHKVTDTRITPRTVSRILAQDGIIPSGNQIQLDQNNSNQGSNTASSNNSLAGANNGNNSINNNNNNNNNSKNNNQQQFNSQPPSVQASTPTESPSPRGPFHPPPPSMLPVSLPTSVAIPNPSLHESQVFSPYSPFFNPHGPPHGGPHGPQPSQFHHMKVSSSPPGMNGMLDPRDSPPLPHPPTMLHPALLAAAHHGNSPDYGHIRASMDVNDRNSDCNSAELSYNGMEPTSSTLTPMHLRKAKLMFFWVRYPSSAVLKMYFPDIKFNKNNTAQLVKWFSNFREFYYIQMEKYARQSASEGMKNVDDIHVGNDSEIYRVLNLHYNRNNHIEVPQNFRYVVEQTLREFFRAIQGGKDTEQSWKKSIYKIISRLDDPVPEYFKSPNFLEQLE